MQITILLLAGIFCLSPGQGAGAEIATQVPDELPKSYSRELSDHEKSNCEYLIRKLTSSWPILLMNKGELTHAGNQLADVHPLSFFAYIFEDAQLNRKIRRMNSSAWGRFRGDWADSLQISYENNEVTNSVIEDFSKRVKLPVDVIRGYVNDQRWEDLIQHLVDHAPYVGK